MTWQLLLDSGKAAAEQMACDDALARDGRLAARFFTWQTPAISLGFKQPLPEWLHLPAWRAGGLEVAERPTGGGIAFHGSDLSVAVVVPRELGLPIETSMQAVCHSAVRLCQSFHVNAAAGGSWTGRGRITYCLAEPGPYAVVIGSRKVAGFAWRRYPETVLIQGSILLKPLPPALDAALPPAVRDRLAASAIALSEGAGAIALDEAARRWAAHWASWWEAHVLEELVS